MRASLFFKFTLAFILVVLAGICLMAFLANRSATGGLSLYVDRGSELWAHRLAPVLVAYYSRQQSWAGIDQFLTQGPRVDVRRRVGQGPRRRTLDGPSDKRLWWLADHRLILGDSQNRVVFDSDSQMTGQDLGNDIRVSMVPLLQDLGNDIRVSMVPLLLDNQRIGSLLIAQYDEGLLEQQFLDRVNQGLALAALGTIVIALVAAVLLSRQLTSPIRRLTAAAQGIAAGRLDQRVSVSSRDEVGQLADSFNEMAGKLQLGETQRRRMLADIAHELRNPLSAIQGNLEGMLDGVLPLKPAQVATAYDQTLILSRLVEDLRLLSLAEARQLHLEKSETDVGLLVQSVVDNFRPLAQERGVDLRTQVPAVPTMAAVDPQRISQVVANLLSNALRYVAGGDTVTVAVRRIDTGSEVAVSDSGPGIDEDELPHVFERFYRVEKSRSRSAGGSGLGLAIAKEFVEIHGGRIWVESQAGKGSKFTFAIPS